MLKKVYSFTKQRIWIPQLIAILMLLWALYPDNPYGYYNLLRVICCAVCVYLCVQGIVLENKTWPWILGVTAVIYNPIIPVKMARAIWTVVNILTIIMLGVSVFVLKRNGQKQRGQ